MEAFFEIDSILRANEQECQEGDQQYDEANDNLQHGILPPHLALQFDSVRFELCGSSVHSIGLVDKQVDFFSALQNAVDVLHHDGLHVFDIRFQLRHFVGFWVTVVVHELLELREELANISIGDGECFSDLIKENETVHSAELLISDRQEHGALAICHNVVLETVVDVTALFRFVFGHLLQNLLRVDQYGTTHTSVLGQEIAILVADKDDQNAPVF